MSSRCKSAPAHWVWVAAFLRVDVMRNESPLPWECPLCWCLNAEGCKNVGNVSCSWLGWPIHLWGGGGVECLNAERRCELIRDAHCEVLCGGGGWSRLPHVPNIPPTIPHLQRHVACEDALKTDARVNSSDRVPGAGDFKRRIPRTPSTGTMSSADDLDEREPSSPLDTGESDGCWDRISCTGCFYFGLGCAEHDSEPRLARDLNSPMDLCLNTYLGRILPAYKSVGSLGKCPVQPLSEPLVDIRKLFNSRSYQ